MNEKKNKGRGIHSILYRVLALIALAVVLVTAAILLVTIPAVKENMTETNQHYLRDVTHAYGTTLELLESDHGEDMYDVTLLSGVIGGAGLEGIDSSYAYLVDRTGMMKYHPTTSKIGEQVENDVVKNLVKQLEKGIIPEPDVIGYEFKGVQKYAAYYVAEDGSFILVITADEDEIMELLHSMIAKCAVVAAAAMIVCIAVGVVGAVITIRPIKQVTAQVARLEELDFTADGNQDKLNNRKDETGDMSRALSRMREKIAEFVSDLQNQSDALLDAASVLEGNSNETISAIEQVERAVQDIADGATSQANETQGATESVVSIGKMIEQTSEEVERLKARTEVMAEASDDANVILKELSEINKKAIESAGIIYEQTNTTNASALKIREATNLIASIAEETNLLSLNASIEAARAGEQGRGFAVVAAQIQKLAEQSNQSTNQIEKIISMLISDSEKAVETMDEVKQIMNEQNEMVVKTSQTFGKVKKEIDASVEGISHIAASTEEMQDARNNVVDVVQNLTAIAEENAASTEETSASVTEISTIVGNIAENAGALKQIAATLEEDMKKFKL